MKLEEIEQHARAYADARAELAERVQALQDEIEAAKRRKLRGIKSAVAKAAEAHDELHAAVVDSPDLFARPRTKVLSGIRIGYTKQKGKLIIGDPGKTIQLIRRHFPEREEALIKISETAAKKALETMSAAELKRINVLVEDAGDKVVIKPTDSEVDKLVAALLAEAEQIEAAESA